MVACRYEISPLVLNSTSMSLRSPESHKLNCFIKQRVMFLTISDSLKQYDTYRE